MIEHNITEYNAQINEYNIFQQSQQLNVVKNWLNTVNVDNYKLNRLIIQSLTYCVHYRDIDDYDTALLEIEVLEAIEGIDKVLNTNQYSLLIEALNTLVMPTLPLPLDNVKSATEVYYYIIKTIQSQLPYFNLYITDEQEAGVYELIHDNIEKLRTNFECYLNF
jgi:hypothetical protein